MVNAPCIAWFLLLGWNWLHALLRCTHLHNRALQAHPHTPHLCPSLPTMPRVLLTSLAPAPYTRWTAQLSGTCRVPAGRCSAPTI